MLRIVMTGRSSPQRVSSIKPPGFFNEDRETVDLKYACGPGSGSVDLELPRSGQPPFVPNLPIGYGPAAIPPVLPALPAGPSPGALSMRMASI